MGFYSSWVHISIPIARGIFALLLWINVIIPPIHDGPFQFFTAPWVYTIICAIYTTTNRFKKIWSSIAKVYAPFIIIIYWAGMYPMHHPWKDSVHTYIAVLTIVTAGIMILEIVIPRNTHFTSHKQTNADFPISTSFTINTVFYIIYTIIYLLYMSSGSKDVIYAGLGLDHSVDKDAMLAFIGWLILMGFNTVISVLTWWRRSTEWNYDNNITMPEENVQCVSVYEIEA